MLVKFIISGNHENPRGNPLPKLRKTGNQHWTPEVKRYIAWKSFVQQCFFSANNYQKIRIGPCDHRADILCARRDKPIDSNTKARMDLKIYWANRAHGDPENVFGSIADALFVNDKHLDGSFESFQSEEASARVEVTINISEL